MSTITVGWIIDVVEKKILDENNDDFSQTELIGYYNLALRLIVALVPRAYTLTEAFKLASGTFQSIPSNGIKLIDISMNVDTDGETYMSPVVEADIMTMRTMVPGWATETPTQEIEHFMRLPEMDAAFQVYPPSDGTGYILGTFSAVPPTTTYDESGDWETNRVPLPDDIVPALPDAICYQAYDDDSDIPGNTPRSQMYYERVLNLLGIKSQQEKR